jgi:deferrochelatase/peroxidase EfeB
MNPQHGILERSPEHLAVAALAFVDRTPTVARDTLELLREIVRRELRSDLDEMSPGSPKDQPPAETGELGFLDGYDRANLTITAGIAASGFEALGVAPNQLPADLIEIPWDQLADAPAKRESGDLVLQVCGDDPYIVEHVLRRVQEELGQRLAIVWTQAGVQRYTTRRGRASRREGRALNGFLDGTSNLRPRDNPDDFKLVFVDLDHVEYPPLPQSGQQGGYPGTGPTFPGDLRPPPDPEPKWCEGGTYMVVRSSVFEIDGWDDQTLGAQEQTIGRFKYSGASLDLSDDTAQFNAPPAFETNQGDTHVPFDSHVRKVNPRRPEDLPRRIFRRGYPLVDATLDGVRRGLVFICFARTLSTQFEFIQRAWTTNPNFPQQGTGVDRLRQFEKVICGGYYFVPPIKHKRQPWSWVLPETAA